MDNQHKSHKAVRYLRADRVSTDDAAEARVEEDVCVIKEAPVTIDVEGIETYTILATPIDRLELAAGFLFSEGVIERLADIEILKECDDDPDTIRVRLSDRVPRIDDSGRNLLIVSSCGACGSENLRERIDALPRVGDTLKIEARLLRSIYSALRERQKLFELCGGTHAAAVFDEDGKILSWAEDTGRHNALDKAIGKCLIAGVRTAGRGAVMTSRLSLEMVGKCARAGFELIAAVSAPTSLAIDVARNCNITLCAFVRETRATVFTHQTRLFDTPVL